MLHGVQRALNGLAGALPLQLTIDSPRQVVGGKASYRLYGAPPGAGIRWTSYKNGAATGETDAVYPGQTVEANGTVELTSEAWRTDDIGEWVKEVKVVAEDGTVSPAYVRFTVSAAPVAPAPGAAAYQPASDSALFYLGDTAITPLMAGIGLVLLYFVFGKK